MYAMVLITECNPYAAVQHSAQQFGANMCLDHSLNPLASKAQASPPIGQPTAQSHTHASRLRRTHYLYSVQAFCGL